MARKSKALADLAVAGLNFVYLVKDASSLIGHDMRLAGKSLAYLFVVFFCVLFLMISVLISLFAMLFYFLLSLQFSVFLALWIIMLVNLVLLGILFYAINRIKRKIFFPRIRAKIAYFMSFI